MTPAEQATIQSYIVGNFPSFAATEEWITVFDLECGPLPGDAMLAVLRDFAADGHPWPPTPAHLAAMTRRRLTLRIPDADEVYREIMTAKARVGRYEPEPQWSHPAIHDLIVELGGWGEGGWEPQTENSPFAEGRGVAHSEYAKLRDFWNALRSRIEREEQRPAIVGSESGAPAAIDQVVSDVIKRADDDA